MKRTKQEIGVMIGYRKAEIKKQIIKSNLCLIRVRQLTKEVNILEKEYEENDF